MLTRDELEDIMNNKPHGYGKQFKKKGMKKSTFIAAPYTKTKLEPITITVYGSGSSRDFDDAKYQFDTIYAKSIIYDGVDWKRQV